MLQSMATGDANHDAGLNPNLMASAKPNPISAARELNETRRAIDHVWRRCERLSLTLDWMVLTESTMMNFRLIAAVMISFVLAGPAMAMHPKYYHRAGRELPVVDATPLDGPAPI